MTIISQGSLKGNGGEIILYALHFATIKHVVNFIRPISTLSGISETSDLPFRFGCTKGSDESHVRGSDFTGLFQPAEFLRIQNKRPIRYILCTKITTIPLLLLINKPITQQHLSKVYFFYYILPINSKNNSNGHCIYIISLIYDTDVLLPHHTSKPGDQTPGYLKNTLTKIDRQPITMAPARSKTDNTGRGVTKEEACLY